MGFAKAFHFAEISQLKQPISKISGMLWLFTSGVFISVLLLFLLKQNYWWMIAVAAILLSQILIVQNWGDAKFGTIPNIIILLPVIIAFTSALPSSFANTYRAEVQQRIGPIDNLSIMSETEIKHLPETIQKYLRYAGVMGKPKVNNFRLVFSGEMKQKMGAKWMDILSEQYNFYDEYARFFYIKSSLYGIPFDGLHKYFGNKATMKIKVASLLEVVNAKGKEMDKSDTVTLFNDMCVFAPATLIDNNIQWEQVDPLTAQATFSNTNISISATLYFNEEGALINFISNDRYYTENGEKYINYKWSTPISGYKDFKGRKIPSYGEAIWHTPEGEFAYARFYVKEIEYNLVDYKFDID
jgi:hypothetical protein